MLINTKNIVSITEANKNFSKVAKTVNEQGEVIILKNNKPEFILSKFNDNCFSESDMLELVARRILSKHRRAFEELGK